MKRPNALSLFRLSRYDSSWYSDSFLSFESLCSDMRCDRNAGMINQIFLSFSWWLAFKYIHSSIFHYSGI